MCRILMCINQNVSIMVYIIITNIFFNTQFTPKFSHTIHSSIVLNFLLSFMRIELIKNIDWQCGSKLFSAVCTQIYAIKNVRQKGHRVCYRRQLRGSPSSSSSSSGSSKRRASLSATF